MELSMRIIVDMTNLGLSVRDSKLIFFYPSNYLPHTLYMKVSHTHFISTCGYMLQNRLLPFIFQDDMADSSYILMKDYSVL